MVLYAVATHSHHKNRQQVFIFYRMKNYMKNMYSKLMALLTLLVVGNLTAAADNKVYISDFSIEAGEEKEIAINFDTDATDVIFLQGTINLPEGLTIVKNAYGKNKNAKADETRAEGFNAQLNGTTGKFSIVSTSGDPFTGNTGAVATFKVTATTALAPSSVIQITDLSTKPVSAVTTQDATVTCTAAAGEVNIMTADPTEISLAPGGTAEVAITLTNETNELEGFSAHLTLPDGLTAEIVPGNRTTGKINYSATSGNIFKVGTISGNDGVLFTIKLTAASSFVAPATIVLDEIALSTSDASSSIDLDNVVINVAAAAPEVNSMSADLTEVSLAPGLTAEVAVTLTNETNELEGFSAHLTLPDGITAEIVPGNRTTGKISYSAASGNIFKVGAISGNDGVLFTIKLTASETFAGSGAIVLDEIALSTSDASTSIDLDNVTINVKDISKDIFNDYKDTQKAAADALAQEGDSEAAQKIITDAKAAIDALTYDESKTLAENKAAVDAIIAPLADALAAQRAADQLAADKAAFDAYKTEQKAAADALAQEGDSEAAQKIITDAKAAIDALTYDESKTLAENKTAVDDIIAKLQADLAAQREQDAQSNKPIPGDVSGTGNGKVEENDLDAFIEDFLNGNIPTDPSSDDFIRYDANQDGKIDVADAQAILNLWMGRNADGTPKTAGARSLDADALQATMNIKATNMGGGITRYTISLYGGMNITGLQMDVVTTQSAMVVSEQLVNNTTALRSNTLTNGTHRIIGLLGSELTANGEVLYVDVMGAGETPAFQNVVLTNAAARSIMVGDATGISAIENAQSTMGNYYDLNGRKMTKNTKKGLVIVDGKKVVLK